MRWAPLRRKNPVGDASIARYDGLKQKPQELWHPRPVENFLTGNAAMNG